MTQPRTQQLKQSGATLGQVPMWDGTVWAPGQGYAMDALPLYDVHHGPPLGTYSQEFNAAETTSLPSGWSWVNQGDSTYGESGGLGRILAATSGGTTSATETHRMIVRALPTESEWIAELKLTGLNGEQAATVRGGMVLRNSGSGNYLFFGRAVSDANIGRFKVDRWSALNTVDTVEHERLMVTPPTVLRLTFYDTGNSSFYVGTDGLITYWVGDVDLSAEGYDQIGILCGTPDTALDSASVSFDWVRVR